MATNLYISLLGLIYIALSIYVIKGRRKFRVAINHGGNENMKRRIRAHANFAEYTPIFLLMLFLSEYQGLQWFYINLFGCIFLIGRILHAYGILKAEHYVNNDMLGVKFRITGMTCTFLCILALSLILLGFYLF